VVRREDLEFHCLRIATGDLRVNDNAEGLRDTEPDHLVEIIIFYLGDGTDLVPTERYERAQMIQWLCFEQYEVEPNLAVVRFLRRHHSDEERYSERIIERTALGYKALAAMEKHLVGRDWFVGTRPSLADISLFGYTHVAGEGDFELSRFPEVLAWIDRVCAMPGHIPIDA
jgi:glutathione S-transferase